jgi:glycerophosphoryl diester phosphodiesterase
MRGRHDLPGNRLRLAALPRAFVASHRGRGAAAGRENTLEAFRSVIDQGASVIELDVRSTADGRLVLWHDDDIAGRRVRQLRLSELRRVAPWFVPTLDECVAALRGKVRLDVEIKVPGIEQAVVDALRRSAGGWSHDQFVITSFLQAVIEDVRAYDARVRTGLLVDSRQSLEAGFDQFAELGVVFLAPAHSLVDAEAAGDARADAATHRRDARAFLERAVNDKVPLVPWSDSAALAEPARRAKEARLAGLLGHRAVAGVITDDVAGAIEVRRTMKIGDRR